MKKQTKHLSRRGLALFLAFAMCAGTPVTAWAEEGGNDSVAVVDPKSDEDGNVIELNVEINAGENTWTAETGNGGTVSGTLDTHEGENGTSTTWTGGSSSEDGRTTVSVSGSSSENTTQGADGDIVVKVENSTVSTETTVDDRNRPVSQDGAEKESGTTTTTTVTDGPQDQIIDREPTLDGNGQKIPGGTEYIPGNDGGFDMGEDQEYAPDDRPILTDVDEWELKDGQDEIRVDVKFENGKDEAQKRVEIVVDTSGVWEHMKAKPDGAKDYEDPDTHEKGYSYTDQDGTEIIVIEKANTDENGNITGYDSTVITTSRGTKTETDTAVSEQPEATRPGDPVRQTPTVEISPAVYDTVPEPYVGENGNTFTTTYEPLYDTDDNGGKILYKWQDGRYIVAEDGQPVAIGYLSTVIETNGAGEQVSCSKKAILGTRTTTTQYFTDREEDWKIITRTSVQTVTRVVTETGQELVVEKEPVDANGNKTTSGVWLKMERSEGQEHGVRDESKELTPAEEKKNAAEPGKTDGKTDLYNRAPVGRAVMAERDIHIYNWDGETNSSITRSSETISADTVFFVGITKKIGGELWGKVGNNRWIRLSSTSEVANPDEYKRAAEEGRYLYTGEFGLESAFMVNGSGTDSQGKYQAHQFAIYDSEGKVHYVYCADFHVNPQLDAAYGKTDIVRPNFWNENTAVNEVIAGHVQAIAMHGYWGTESGSGSLEYVKKMLKESADENGRIAYTCKGQTCYISKDDVDKLTDEMALTATQAAIWSYATSGNSTINVEEPFGRYHYGYVEGKEKWSDGQLFEAGEKEVAMALYSYLRGLTETSYRKEEIGKDNIVGGGITVKSLATDENNNPIIVSEEDKTNTVYKYNTDISFILNVEPSQLNDNLLVSLLDADGNPLKDENGNPLTWRVAGKNTAAQNLKGVTITTDEKNQTVCTIENVQLTEGVTVTLNLHGTQLVEKGAYLVVAHRNGMPDSSYAQTFVGAEEKIHAVDLNVDLTFNVREPSVKLHENGTRAEGSRTDTYNEYEYQTLTRRDIVNEIVVTQSEWGERTWHTTTVWPDDPVTPPTEPEDPGTPDIPDTPVPLVNIPEDGVPLAGLGSGGLTEILDEDVPLAAAPLIDIFDEEVPLAAVPATGDISLLWYVMTMFAACGLLILTIPDGRRRRAEHR